MNKIIYLDNSATTQPFIEVIDEVVKYMKEEYGNPSSLYRMGITAEKGLYSCREEIARAINAFPEEIVFTSGGTESNNLAIEGVVQPYLQKNKTPHIITTEIEHPSVKESFLSLKNKGAKVTFLPVDSYGLIDLEQLEESIQADTILVSIMHVNNEIGTIQNIVDIGEVIRRKNPTTFFHVDGVQAFCRVPLSMKNSNIHFYSMSGHKIHAPKGVGALFIKKGVRITNLFYGGGQESGIRSGTENVPGIMGFRKAVELFNFNREDYRSHIQELKELLANKILTSVDGTTINGPFLQEGAPHILNISFAGIRGEVLLHALEQKGIMVSTGSACSSRKQKISYILSAIGVNRQLAEGAIRFSLSPLNTKNEIYKTVEALVDIVKYLRKFRR